MQMRLIKNMFTLHMSFDHAFNTRPCIYNIVYHPTEAITNVLSNEIETIGNFLFQTSVTAVF